MRFSCFFAASLIIGMLGHQASYADTNEAPKRLTYQEAKTRHEEFMQGRPTKTQRVNEVRSLIRASPVGARGLNQIYKNFEGKYSIDPTVPGFEKSVLNQLSASAQQAKGYRREVLYAVSYQNDPRYSLVEMNRPLRRTWGNTDADLVIRHVPTGFYGRVEVKDYSLQSQQRNLAKLKVQIDKMALEGGSSGQAQFWMNSRGVIPEIFEYGQRAGVLVSSNVKTGKTVGPGAISIREAMDQQERQFVNGGQRRAMVGAGGLAFAVLGLKSVAPEAASDLAAIMDPMTRSDQAMLRFGEHASSTLAGGALVVSGGAWSSAPYVREAMQSRLYSVGRIGGVTAIAAFGLSEAFHVARYARGDVLDRAFWTHQWVLGSSTTGGLLGWGAGALVTKSPWGAFTGTTLGGYLGGEFGTRTASTYYDFKFRELDEAYGKWVYAQYAVK